MDAVDRLNRKVIRQSACLSGALLWACLLFSAQATAADIGSKVSDFQLPDASGAIRSLHSFPGKAVAIVFWSYKCPVSLAYVDRIGELSKEYGGKGVEVIAIDASVNETPAEVRANIANLKFTIPVLLDSEGVVSEKLGATQTPSVFIIDGEDILRYKGAFDNNKRRGEGGRIGYAEDALDSILSGRAVGVAETRPFGCSIRPAKGNR
jgi:thiol-disulfide isomerase/thioredoxin